MDQIGFTYRNNPGNISCCMRYISWLGVRELWKSEKHSWKSRGCTTFPSLRALLDASIFPPTLFLFFRSISSFNGPILKQPSNQQIASSTVQSHLLFDTFSMFPRSIEMIFQVSFWNYTIMLWNSNDNCMHSWISFTVKWFTAFPFYLGNST